MGSILANAGDWVKWLGNADWYRYGLRLEEWIESSFESEGGFVPGLFERGGVLCQLL